MKKLQSGLSLLGLLFWGAIISVLVLIGAVVVPSVTEYREISSAVQRIANTETTVRDIQIAFDKQAAAGYITTIRGADLDISKDVKGNVVIKFEYEKKIPLAGPVSLVIDYAGSSQAR